MEYNLRFYREWVSKEKLVTFGVTVRETDLQIRASRDFSAEALKRVKRLRLDIETWDDAHPGFIETLEAWPADPSAPPIVAEMIEAARAYGIGPMAAVAGAIAEAVGRDLLTKSDEVIVENGGDVFLKLDRAAKLMLYAGEESPFNRRLIVKIKAPGERRGVCTSSAKIGPSLSMGRTDAVMAVAESAALADAAATALGNRVKSPADVEAVLEAERKRGLLLGAVIIAGETLGAFGEVELEKPK